jgi:hypothetical protein
MTCRYYNDPTTLMEWFRVARPPPRAKTDKNYGRLWGLNDFDDGIGSRSKDGGGSTKKSNTKQGGRYWSLLEDARDLHKAEEQEKADREQEKLEKEARRKERKRLRRDRKKQLKKNTSENAITTSPELSPGQSSDSTASWSSLGSYGSSLGGSSFGGSSVGGSSPTSPVSNSSKNSKKNSPVLTHSGHKDLRASRISGADVVTHGSTSDAQGNKSGYSKTRNIKRV